MKKEQVIKIICATVMIFALSSCVSKKKKKCNTCPTWGSIEVNR